MTQQAQAVIDQMKALITSGAQEIMKDNNVNQATAEWTALMYACEWLHENKPAVAAKWINILQADKVGA